MVPDEDRRLNISCKLSQVRAVTTVRKMRSCLGCFLNVRKGLSLRATSEEVAASKLVPSKLLAGVGFMLQCALHGR